MLAGPQPSLLGVARPKIIGSGADLISELQALRRPVVDVKFKEASRQSIQIADLRVGGLVLTEARTEPIVWYSKQEPSLSFVIPLSGNGSVVERGQSVQWAAAHNILQLTYAHSLEAHSNESHFLEITPQMEDLERAVAAIPDAPERLIEKLMSAWTETHQGIFNNVDYYRHARELISLIGLARGNGKFLKRIGIDDVFNRLLAEMLVAKSGYDPNNKQSVKSTRSERAVELICDHIASNIGSPLTIPKMEELSGLTGRSLNYAFQSRFNCSPQEWQRNYLLDQANMRLKTTIVPTSIKKIAYELGFSSSSSFSSYYKRRFGELPSDTGRSVILTSANFGESVSLIDGSP